MDGNPSLADSQPTGVQQLSNTSQSTEAYSESSEVEAIEGRVREVDRGEERDAVVATMAPMGQFTVCLASLGGRGRRGGGYILEVVF